MVDKLTGDIANTSDTAHALEKRVSVSAMEQKQRIVSVAGSGYFTITELCRDFGISRQTGYKWAAGGMKGLEEHSRAPKSVTCRTTDEVERLIDGVKIHNLTKFLINVNPYTPTLFTTVPVNGRLFSARALKTPRGARGLPEEKGKGIKDQRGELAFPAGEHHSAGQHHQDKGHWFRDTGDSEPHVAALERGMDVVAVGSAQVNRIVVPRAAPQPARRAQNQNHRIVPFKNVAGLIVRPIGTIRIQAIRTNIG